MRPLRDPIKNLVFSATSRVVDTVIVDGRKVVAGGRVLTLDEDRLAREIQDAAEEGYRAFPSQDWAGRTVEEMSPVSFPVREL